MLSNSQTDGEPLSSYRIRLRNLLSKLFSLDELKTLAFDLEIDFEELGGETKSAKVREFILYSERLHLLESLITRAEHYRPQIHWRRVNTYDARCPYLGLSSFTEEDASFFFGREEITNHLYRLVQQKKFTVVVGPSGSGKSSIVFAGLVPKLREDKEWIIVHCRPSKQPFYELGKALTLELETQLSEIDKLTESQKLGNAFEAGQIELSKVLERILEVHDNKKRLLLVIDQFEELFTLPPNQKVREDYIDLLLNCTDLESTESTKTLSVSIVLTLRGDFMGHALSNRPLADAFQDNDLKLGPMTSEELREVILKPAKIAGLTFETGLVERILDDIDLDVNHYMNSGNLPLLEFALEQLWQFQTKNGYLTHEAYNMIGAVDGAITRYANDIYAALKPDEQKNIRHVLVQMVYPGENREDSRRWVSRQEIGNSNWSIVRQLAEDRLVVTDQNSIGEEVAGVIHEALIQNWRLMQQWMEEDREFRSWQERMRLHLSIWSNSKSPNDYLGGTLLRLSQDWLQKRPERFTAVEAEFIRNSDTFNKAQMRRSYLLLFSAGGIGGVISAAIVTAVAGFILWPVMGNLQDFSRSEITFLFGIQGGVIGFCQGAAIMSGVIIVLSYYPKQSLLIRVLCSMITGGIIGSLLFVLMRGGGGLPSELSYQIVSLIGFILFSLTSGAIVLPYWQAYGKSLQLLRRTILGALGAGLVTFVVIGGLYLFLKLESLGATPFLPTALGFSALESVVAGGMNFGLGLASQAHNRNDYVKD